MSLARILLRPAARIAGMRASRQARAFMDSHRHTRRVQESLLDRLIKAASDSEFGREHNFGRIRSYEDFASAVPIGDYETHRRYVERVLSGQVDAMFAPGTKIRMFAVTSGTTGSPKHIPVTEQFLRDYRRGWNIFGIQMLKDHPDGWLRKIITIGSSARENTSPTGLPCGAISGLLVENQQWVVRKMYPVSPQVNDIGDASEKYYAIMRSSVAQDIGIIITPNPSTAVKLAQIARDNAERLIRDVRDGTISISEAASIEAMNGLSFRPNRYAAKRLEEIIQRHGQLLPKYFWNLSFMLMWTGGTVGLYLPSIRRYYGDAPIRDMGLLASEGRLSVPLADNSASGVAEITSNFFEFIPADQIESAGPDVLGAHELSQGEEYFVLFSNWSGLWRYNIDDRIRVTGRFGDSPVFEFLSKGMHACSITGEKITEHQVVRAMEAASARAGAGIEQFVLQGHFAETPYYELRIEASDKVNIISLAQDMDKALCGLNVEYDSKRRSGRLGPIRPVGVPAGAFAEQQARQINHHRNRPEQYKHKFLMTEVVNAPPTWQ
ncbi:MAG: GH3 auxin-responsive promoter family protein [Planctomycetota bacterium]|nr:GH3 auxin-responsive promoter family protein [Planctomycetota bacterium]